MASSANTPQQPPYPTHAALEAAKQFLHQNPEGLKLLFWPLNADTPATLETSGLEVMAAGPKYPNPDIRVPYYDAQTGAWHPVSKQPISEPKMSDFVVRASDILEWERTWKDLHWEHGLEDNRMPELVARGEGICHGCGVARPPAHDADVSVVVKGTGGVSEGEEGGFVTVHDYVSTVHPWLVGLRDIILGAVGTSIGNDDPLPAETQLMVRCRLMDKVSVVKWEDWIRNARKQPSPGFSLRELMAQNGVTNMGLFGPGGPGRGLEPGPGPRWR